MAQIYHKGSFYSGGGGEETSLLKKQLNELAARLEEINQEKLDIQNKLNELNTKEISLANDISTLQQSLEITTNTANNAVPKSMVHYGKNATVSGYPLDSRMINPAIPGTFGSDVYTEINKRHKLGTAIVILYGLSGYADVPENIDFISIECNNAGETDDFIYNWQRVSTNRFYYNKRREGACSAHIIYIVP